MFECPKCQKLFRDNWDLGKHMSRLRPCDTQPKTQVSSSKLTQKILDTLIDDVKDIKRVLGVLEIYLTTERITKESEPKSIISNLVVDELFKGIRISAEKLENKLIGSNTEST